MQPEESLGYWFSGDERSWLTFLLLQTTALLFRNESMRSDYNKGKGRIESKPVQLPKQVRDVGLLAIASLYAVA